MTDAAPAVAIEVTSVQVPMPTLRQLIEMFEAWEEQTADAQEDARRDRRYYDGQQWTAEEVAKLRERRQPVITKNRIARKINFILGEEIRKRVDPIALPKTPTHEDAARSATDALRAVEEMQQFDEVRSAVFKNVLVEGYGGAVVEVDDDDQRAIGLRHVQWERLFYDPASADIDFGDAKYLGVVLWMDLEDAVLQYPDAEEDLRSAVNKDVGTHNITTDDKPRFRWTDRQRQRVKICECYFRVGKDWFRADYTEGALLLEPQPTGYSDHKGRSTCPLIMTSCYVDSENNRYGVVRNLISPQDEINKRASKSLHLLNVQQVIHEDDAIDDVNHFQAELAKPDGAPKVRPGRLTDNSVQVRTNQDLVQGHVVMMQEAKQDIDGIGPSSATLPNLPESASGRAFIARQQAASQELGQIFDALRSWDLRVFRQDWACIRQFWTEEKWLRVTDDQSLTGYRFVGINRQYTRAQRMQEMQQQGAPFEAALGVAVGTLASQIMREAQQGLQQQLQQAQMMGLPPPQPPMMQQLQTQAVMAHPLMQESLTENQIDQLDVDIIIEESPDTVLLEQEEFKAITEIAPMILQGRQDMAPQLVKLLVQASQLRNKKALLEALDKGPDPQQVQMQQQHMQMQMQSTQADIAKNQSQAQLNQARAMQAQADAQGTQPQTLAEVAAKYAQAQRDKAQAQATAAGVMPPWV